MARSKTLAPGDRMPDVTLPGTDKESVRLWDLVGEKTLVVYFYPKDETPGCTVEACRFRDSYHDFVDLGAEVVGISGDPPASHEAFRSKHELPFILLSDVDGRAREAFGVRATLGILPGRVTFVVDRSGIVRHVFESQLRVNEHVKRALDLVRRLEGEPGGAAPARR